MASNTKLTKEQKQDLKNAKMEYGDKLEFATSDSGRVTVACYRASPQIVKFSTSIASPDEVKIRRKVGEYNALERIESGQYAMAVYPSDIWNLAHVAELIAEDLDNCC